MRCGRTPRSARSTSVLEVEALHTYYGESHVLQGVSLGVAGGEVVTILGRNGMGKTTLVRSIIGFTPPRRGRIRFKDRDITGWPPFRAVALGLGLVPQGRRVFPSLTVRENLEVARRGPGRWSASMRCSRSCGSDGGRRPGRSRAASSRCWPSAGR